MTSLRNKAKEAARAVRIAANQREEAVSEKEMDVEYVRAMGEEVRARLFPRPKIVKNELGEEVDGPTPVPLPCVVFYDPYNDGEGYEVLFVPERSTQRVNQEAPDVSLSSSRIFAPPNLAVTADLEFGKNPKVYVPSSTPTDAVGESLAALLKAITGTLS